MLLARGIDVSDHLGTVFGIPPPRSRRDASAALPPRSLQARWPRARRRASVRSSRAVGPPPGRRAR